MNGGDFDPFHVTLAYRIAPIPQNLQHDLQEIKMQVMSMLFNFDILELGFIFFNELCNLF
jgi:hypothetical protein